MPILYDARGNEYQGLIDGITGQTVTDARSATASLGALNAESVVDLNGVSVVMVDARSAAFTGTVVFEGTVDGTNYIAIPGINVATNAMIAFITGAGAVTGTATAVGVTGFRRFRVRCSAFTSGALTVALRATVADYAIYSLPMPSTTAVTVTAAANTAATLTLAAAGAGLFHYITAIEITRNATAALAGTATLVVTTTNLPGSLAWSVGNAMVAGGTQIDVSRDFAQPLKSSAANTATTIVMPAPGAAVLWRANAYYYVGA